MNGGGTLRINDVSYPGVLELLRRRAGEVQLAIATAKDGASVGALLARYGVAELFPAERILDKESGAHKAAHLRLLAERLACPLPELTFVDDKVNHLESVAPLGVSCALAAWGYIGVGDTRTAPESGYPAFEQTDVVQLFSNPFGLNH